MMLRILEGEEVASENKLADLCNFFSLKYIAPVGATDTKKVTADLEFTLAGGDERFHVDKGVEQPSVEF